MTDDNRISITICGDGGCGKSSITLRLVRSEWTEEYDPTIEDSYSVTRIIDGVPYFLSLVDTAGQEEYRTLWASSNLKSDAFLLVYDITAPQSLSALQYYIDMIEMEADQREEDGRIPPIKVIVGNKSDLKESREIGSQQALAYARTNNCGFMECSAKEKVNIEETFALIVRRVLEQRRGPSEVQTTNPQSRPSGRSSQLNPKPATEKRQTLSSVDLEDRPGPKTQRGGFWARLRCW